jgi:hypothetical protein
LIFDGISRRIFAIIAAPPALLALALQIAAPYAAIAAFSMAISPDAASLAGIRQTPPPLPPCQLCFRHAAPPPLPLRHCAIDFRFAAIFATLLLPWPLLIRHCIAFAFDSPAFSIRFSPPVSGWRRHAFAFAAAAFAIFFAFFGFHADAISIASYFDCHAAAAIIIFATPHMTILFSPLPLPCWLSFRHCR